MKWGKNKAGKDGQKRPLKWSMIGMLVLGWLLPLMLLTFCLLYFSTSMIREQIENTIVVSTDKAVEICEIQMSDIITASKVSSYNTELKDAYETYKEDKERAKLAERVKRFLNQQYKYNKNFLCTMVFFLDMPEEIYYTENPYRQTNHGITGFTRKLDFENNAMEHVVSISDELDTAVRLLNIAGHLYLVRNIVDRKFQPYAMIVIQLSPTVVFESLNSVWGNNGYEMYLDGVPVFKNRMGKHFDRDLLKEAEPGVAYYRNDGDFACAYEVINKEKQQISFLVRLDPKMIINSLTMVQYVFALVLIFIIPLVFLVFRFFYNRVTRPVTVLVNAAQEIGKGNYGYTIEKTSNSQEFNYLDTAFNTMSLELKHQFEQIYLEELALKDANIMTLQSQINPHFLNNTLEIINWEARLNGNEKVSEMIEALATMLNATMNRKQKKFVSLEEELTYVDAYLHIIKQRFGERFQVEWNIDESLLNIKIPMLIIQPIVENAVEHGMGAMGKGSVSIHIYARSEKEIAREIQRELESAAGHPQDYDTEANSGQQDEVENRPMVQGKLFIEICNEGELSEEDAKKIAFLLGGNIQEDTERHVSLGIRNVDKRLKIIYGTEYGLSIKSDNAGKTISTIIVKIDNESNISQ